jgi:hypothetical protein
MTWAYLLYAVVIAGIGGLAWVLLRDRPHQPEPDLSAARHRVTDDGQRPGADGQFGTWPTLRVPDAEPACPSPSSPGDGHATGKVRGADA